MSRQRRLAWVIILAAVFRFWNLAAKPLWLDEVVSLVFVSGHRYADFLLPQATALSDLGGYFDWQPQSCDAIAAAINAQSTHPPLFFCLLHQWLGILQHTGLPLAWQLRSLPALFGVAGVLAVYALGQIAVSRQAGLWSAGLMAVSPFAVYLAQEGRHYTLPMLVITWSLIVMVQLLGRRPKPQLWLAWIGLNSLGFYLHYFCLLAFLAEAGALGLAWLGDRRRWGPLLAASAVVGVTLLPWVTQIAGHSQRPETDWLRWQGSSLIAWIEPLLRIIAGWIVMVILLPVEHPGLGLIIVSAILMLAFVAYVIWNLVPRIRGLWQNPPTQLLIYFVGLVLLAFSVIIYGLHKDLSLAFRYHFIYYPAVCVLLGSAIASKQPVQGWRSAQTFGCVLLLAGICSSVGVVHHWVFLKPFQPDRWAQEMRTIPQTQSQGSEPILVIGSIDSGQDVALNLSLLLALNQSISSALQLPTIYWALEADQAPTLPDTLQTHPFWLWHVGALHNPQRSLTLLTQTTNPCLPVQDPQQNMGSQYQLYQCQPVQTRR